MVFERGLWGGDFFISATNTQRHELKSEIRKWPSLHRWHSINEGPFLVITQAHRIWYVEASKPSAVQQSYNKGHAHESNASYSYAVLCAMLILSAKRPNRLYFVDWVLVIGAILVIVWTIIVNRLTQWWANALTVFFFAFLLVNSLGLSQIYFLADLLLAKCDFSGYIVVLRISYRVERLKTKHEIRDKYNRLKCKIYEWESPFFSERRRTT